MTTMIFLNILMTVGVLAFMLSVLLFWPQLQAKYRRDNAPICPEIPPVDTPYDHPYLGVFMGLLYAAIPILLFLGFNMRDPTDGTEITTFEQKYVVCCVFVIIGEAIWYFKINFMDR